MSCSDWESQLEAFADGELPVDASRALRAHLDECSCCRATLGMLRSVRATLVRRWADERAPAGLVEQVRRRVSAQSAAHGRSLDDPVVSGDPDGLFVGDDQVAGLRMDRELVPLDVADRPSTLAVQPVGRRSGSRRFWSMTLATVGAVLLVVGLYRMILPAAPTHRAVTIVANDRFSELRDLHATAVTTRGAGLVTATIPRGSADVAQRLSALVELKVIAPDLSAEGYSLLGGGIVEVGAVSGAQVLYRSASRGLLSVFSLSRMEELRTPDAQPGLRSFFASTLNKTTVVAWHDGAQTYALCSELGRDELFRLIDDLPTAERGLLESMRSVLAAVSPHW